MFKDSKTITVLFIHHRADNMGKFEQRLKFSMADRGEKVQITPTISVPG